eukprot:SAG31_NODE_1188_length_9481_cov_14.760819_3_plen_149_part_00
MQRCHFGPHFKFQQIASMTLQTSRKHFTSWTSAEGGFRRCQQSSTMFGACGGCAGWLASNPLPSIQPRTQREHYDNVILIQTQTRPLLQSGALSRFTQWVMIKLSTRVVGRAAASSRWTVASEGRASGLLATAARKARSPESRDHAPS